MGRLAECWQLSQPPHLRHLAIVRDTVLHRTNALYVHYSARSFKELVEAGEASWEAVEFVPKNASSNIRLPPVDAVPQLDEYGFPVTSSSKELLRNGNSTLFECMAVGKPADYTCSGSDPVAVRLNDGSYVCRLGGQKPLPNGLPQNPSAYRGRPKGKTKRSNEEVSVTVHLDETDDHEKPEVTATKRPKKSKSYADRLKGMTEKEKLEAMGMDESWTEYSIFLIDRPKPGVYVTPRGRRRATGQSRGRPRASQVAIFKSPKLTSLPWFVREGDVEDDAVPERPSSALSAETPIPTFTPNGPAAEDSGPSVTPMRGSKRGFQERQSSDEEATPAATRSGLRGRKPKQRRHDQSADTQDNAMVTLQTQSISVNTVTAASERPKRKRQASPTERVQQSAQTGIEADRMRSKKQRHIEHELEDTNRSVAPTPEITQTPVESARLELVPHGKQAQPEHTEIDHNRASIVDRGQAPVNAATTPNGTRNVSAYQATQPQLPKQGKKGRTDRGGSVAVLRRNIIMDIIEKAGGAYPFGTELWYPFTSAYIKTKSKEKPDMRTIRTTVRHLVDSGKLRQQTFSGRDSKGIMITKSIVTKPETPPDAPVVTEMQHRMLAGESRFYFPPNTEINPQIMKRSSSIIGPVKSESKPISQLPVEPGLTVQLQKKPAVVLAKERRVQRQMLRRLEQEDDAEGGGRAGRLMSLKRRSAHRPATITRPSGSVPGEGVVQRTGKMKQLRTSISSPASFAMLMDPKQTFHATTGTFGTEVGFPARWMAQKPVVPPITPHAMFMNPRQAFHATTGTFGTHVGQQVSRERKTQEISPGIEDLGVPTPCRADRAKGADSRTRQFFRDNDQILHWELENQYLFHEKGKNLHYINQTVWDAFDTAPIRGDIRFDIDQQEQRPTVPARATKPTVTTRRSARRSKVTDDRRPQRLSELLSPAQKAPTTPRQPIRRNRAVHILPQPFIQKLMTAIVAVRVLAGGAEGRMIDWPLVAKCFPELDARFVQDRSRSVLSKNRLQITKMQGDFQERFLEAYANGHVPPIDYNDLDGYDWEGIVEWAQTQLDVPTMSEKVPDLPATRAQFDSVFELREEMPLSLDEAYQHSTVTLNRKRTLFASMPFAEPLHDNRRKPARVDLDHLEVAKTWVRANVVTPEETYRPTHARQSLEHFGEPLITDAVQSLVTDRVIKMGNRGRITPGRNYDITDQFINSLRKRPIESTQLRRAAWFKTSVLDPGLRDNGVAEVDYTAEDGDILALINLYAERKIMLKPREPPRDKYGLTDGSYLTRQIDREKFRFGVDILPVRDSYKFGNPIATAMSNLPPPSLSPPLTPTIPTTEQRIPLWLDIHTTFFKLLWDLVCAAVVGCVATRPGISARGVAGMMRPAVGAWEVGLLLGWMEGVGVVRRSCVNVEEGLEGEDGWVVRGWWWMVLG